MTVDSSRAESPAPSSAGAEVLDLLVVGGGPGGTAAAFRARELGLSTLVIDYDDLMKRIRDYSKDKLILPGFGGGDQMRFPCGGELIAGLHFDPIDKDEMCGHWKGLYAEHGVPFRLGMELTGMERREGILEAVVWDHQQRRESRLRARHVAIALGRGVPRRFDIPGDAEGIAWRLEDPAAYVGQPACVVGGGTSAAEAVIALSRAKVAAGDPTAVYWSYRGDRMPRVSKALAEVFFGAYVGNGNIRYYPKSEPAAIVTGEDRREYLAIRTDRRRLEGRPNEASHLEFPKEHCIACIGEDLPRDLLSSLGIETATGGPRGKTRMVVNRYLESAQPNVYLVGDLLSQAYFETDDFTADPAGFREVKHRGNIKSAMRDGVLVAQVVAQRLAGREEIDLSIVEAEERPGERAGVAVASRALEGERRGPAAAGDPSLIRRLPGGVEAEETLLQPHGVTTLGRSGCDLTFPEDTLLAPRHASVSHTEDGFFLRDDGSSTGVFLQIRPGRKREVESGDLIRLGRQFLRISGGDPAAVTHFDHSGREVARHPLRQGTVVLGRQAPDITLDPRDQTLSRRQLAISVEDGRILVKDLKSVNGSFLRVRNATRLEHGDRFRIGGQRLVFAEREDPALAPGHAAPTPVAATPPAPAEAIPAAPELAAGVDTDSGPSVSFKGSGQRLRVLPGQTLCEAAEAAGIPITAECHAGICGSDPIRILSGHEHLESQPDEQECETLEEICDLEPGECRLACRVRVKGPVEVEIL